MQVIYLTLKNDTLPLFCFMDELNNSRIYCYIIFKLSEEIDEIGVGIEYGQYVVDKLPYIDFNFLEPLCQGDLREFLKMLDKLFLEEGIRIYGILTHQ